MSQTTDVSGAGTRSPSATLKVIGAGFGRTGTLSIKAALEDLGLNPCHHFQSLFADRKKAMCWYEAGQGKPVDWKFVLEGYQAALDWPTCSFYKELMEVYPEAKVLLTVRDPERWYQSTLNTIYPATNRIFSPLATWLIPRLRPIRLMLNSVVWKGTFHGKFEDKPYAIDVFNQHIAEVKRTVPPEKLLVYEVTEGWEPLCRFLDVPVPPDKPFPHLHDTADFQKNMKRAQVRQVAYVSILALLVLAAAWLLM